MPRQGVGAASFSDTRLNRVMDAQVPTTVIGISGPSCSGKSTLASTLAGRLEAAVLPQDLYFKAPEECPADANFCDLQYLDVARFERAATGLMRGSDVEVPVVDFRTFQTVGYETLSARTHLIIEGMTVFRIPRVLDRCDVAVYLAPPFSELVARKRSRDAADRMKSESEIERQLGWMQSEYEYDLCHLPPAVKRLWSPEESLVEEVIASVRSTA